MYLPNKTKTIIPVSESKLGKFNTYSGKVIEIINPAEDQIDMEDIATVLSRICRFGGHSSCFFSVAQHSILVSHLVNDPKIRLEALLHDASEAYLGDVISPLKHLLGGVYKSLECNFENVIAQKFGLDTSAETKAAIKKADLLALELEHEALIMNNPARLLAMVGEDLTIGESWAWESTAAKLLFMVDFHEQYTARTSPEMA